MQQGMAPRVPMHDPKVLTTRMLVNIASRYLKLQLTHATIPAMGTGIVAVECLCIAGLEIFSSWGLNDDHRVVVAAGRVLYCTAESCSTVC